MGEVSYPRTATASTKSIHRRWGGGTPPPPPRPLFRMSLISRVMASVRWCTCPRPAREVGLSALDICAIAQRLAKRKDGAQFVLHVEDIRRN